MQQSDAKRGEFMKSGAALGALGAMPLMAAAAKGGPRAKAAGRVRVGNLFFSYGQTGVRDEVRKDAPARSAVGGVEFPDTATRVEIELVAYIPS